MYVTTEFTNDFQRPRKSIMQVVQDDTTRKIRLILKNGGNDYDITSDLGSEETWVGAVAYLKADGHGGVYDTTKDGEKAVQLVSGTTNQFDVLLVGQVFTAAGWTQVNVKFYNADFSKVLSTFAIDVNVQRNAASDYESEDYSNMQSLGAIRTEITEFEATVRAELLALKADTEQDVTDAYIAAAQETPGLTYDQFFMTLPNGRYRIVINAPAYIYKAEVVTVEEGQYCKVDDYDHDGYCKTTIYRNGTAVFSYTDGGANGRVFASPIQVPAPVNSADATPKEYVDARLTKHNPAATGTFTLTNNNNMLFFEVGSRTLSLFGDGHSGTVELGNLTSPNNNSSAATKGYVDAQIAALEARIAALEV